MNIKLNSNFDQLSENYLFSEINKRVAKYKEYNPNRDIIKLGIGDVTLPLGKNVIEALIHASCEMGKKETFRGYPPEYGYNFLKEAILKYYKRFHVDLDLNSVFISDGAKSDLGNIVDIFGDNPIYIPKTFFSSKEDLETLKNLAKHNLKTGFSINMKEI